jgi:uncharacterized protein YndB with AHSA1/START domain
MAITAHVYQLYVAATPEQVWTAITDSDWTSRYLYGSSFDAPPEPGRRYVMSTSAGPAVDGVIEDMQPPADGKPGRFVQTWHVLYDAAMAQEQPGRVEWTVEPAGEGLTRVRLVHGDLALSPLTWANVKDGWVWILNGMKSLLETGRQLPPVAAEVAEREETEPDWHRAQGVEANNSLWELFTKPDRTDDDVEEMLRRAYTAAYHWQRARTAGPENEARADYMIAKALLLSGQPEASLRSADRCRAVCLEHGLVDFDLAYAHEARARALRALGREHEAADAWAAATAVPIAEQEDRQILDADFADYEEGTLSAAR